MGMIVCKSDNAECILHPCPLCPGCEKLLNHNECIILGNFAENFQFTVQNEVQSYHWNKPKFTLHPVIIYYKSNGKLIYKSFFFLSDDAEHYVYFIYKIQQHITN